MNAVEFQSQLGADGTLNVPEDAAQRIPRGLAVRVLVLLPDDLDASAWEQLAATDFGMGYGDSDAIYDQLSDR